MSTWFVMLVYADVTVDDAEPLKERVLALFREKGLIAGDAKEDCVMGGVGYSPGPACRDLYGLAEHEDGFWTLRICGVEPRVGRDFNYWALGPSCEGSICPACGAEFGPDDRELTRILIDAILDSVK